MICTYSKNGNRFVRYSDFAFSKFKPFPNNQTISWVTVVPDLGKDVTHTSLCLPWKL